MKKKPPEPAPAATKAPDPPAKQAAPPQAAPGPKAGTGEQTPEAATPIPAEQGKDLSEVPVQSAEKKPDEKPSETTDASGEAANDPNKKKVTVPTDPIDWFAMRQPFLNRGVPLTGRDGEQIKQNWTMTYNNMMRFGFTPDLSIKIANIGTPIAYDFAMARDNPTQIEKFDMETEKMMGPGKKLGKIVVPILTPDTLSFAVEKITGKKLDFRF